MNRNSVTQKCLQILAAKRAKAQAVAYANQTRARQDSQYAALERQERELVMQLGKLKAYGQSSREKEAELEHLREEKTEVLKKLGLSAADLEPSYSCKLCGDVGFRAGGMCKCLRDLVTKTITQECGAGKQVLSDFKDFNADLAKDPEHHKQLLKLKKRFEEFASAFPDGTPKFVVLSGKTGVGKTFIVECLAKAIIDKGYLVSFVSAFGLNNLFLSYHTTFDEQKQSYLNALIDPDMLVIDDLGTEPLLKNVTKEYLYLILSERSRLNKMTCITTNLDAGELLSRYEERVFSRLFNKRESFSAQILGTDLRLS